MHSYVVHVTWFLLERGTLKGIHPEHEVMAMIIKSYKNSFSQQCKKMMPWKDTIWAVPFRQYSTQNNSIWLCPCSIKFGTQANTFNTRGYLPKLTLPQWYVLYPCHYKLQICREPFPGLYLVYNIQTLCEPAPQPACMTIKQESKIPKVHTCFKTHTSLSMQPFSTWFPSLRFWFFSG